METTTTLPCWSARHWVSTCRGLSRYCSTKHSPRPNAATASRTAESYSSGISSSVRATFRPRPPPPKAALMAIGRPSSWANATTSSASVDRVGGARDLRRAGPRGDVPGCTLSPRVAIACGRRTDPGQPGVDHGLREVGVLGQEAVARMHGVGAAARGDVEQLVDDEVGLGRGGAAQGERLVGQPRRAGRRGPGRRRRPRRRSRRPGRPGRPGPRSRRGWRSGPSAGRRCGAWSARSRPAAYRPTPRRRPTRHCTGVQCLTAPVSAPPAAGRPLRPSARSARSPAAAGSSA